MIPNRYQFWGYIKVTIYHQLYVLGNYFLYWLGFNRFDPKRFLPVSRFYKTLALQFQTTLEKIREIFELYGNKIDVETLVSELHYLRERKEKER